jgi:hypothetical protein
VNVECAGDYTDAEFIHGRVLIAGRCAFLIMNEGRMIVKAFQGNENSSSGEAGVLPPAGAGVIVCLLKIHPQNLPQFSFVDQFLVRQELEKCLLVSVELFRVARHEMESHGVDEMLISVLIGDDEAGILDVHEVVPTSTGLEEHSAESDRRLAVGAEDLHLSSSLAGGPKPDHLCGDDRPVAARGGVPVKQVFF